MRFRDFKETCPCPSSILLELWKILRHLEQLLFITVANTHGSNYVFLLKVLFSEMDPAESRLIR